MNVRLEFQYEGNRNAEDEHPGWFEKDVERDYVRLPAIGEGVELEPGSEAGGGTGRVTWVMWGGDGIPRLHMEVKAMGTFMSRRRLLAAGWQER